MVRDGLKLSHLCFADDLILFAEVGMDQVVVINQCLESFRKSSRQKISSDKTRIFFSQNMHHTKRREISEALGFL